MRYVVTTLLLILLAIVVGLMLGFVSLDFSAPEGRQLSAAGVLAYWDEDGGGDSSWGSGGVSESYPYYEDPYDGGFDGQNSGGGSSSWYDNPYDDPYWWDDDDDWDDPYDDYYDYYSYGGGGTSAQDPWYVRSFPGFGQVAQQIIPGLNPVPAPAPRPPFYAQPSCWISSQPTSVSRGGSSVLQWSSFNATQASLTDFGTVPTAGTRTVQNITTDRTYTLSVRGQGGNGSCYTRIDVKEQQAMPSCVIAANPEVISRGQTASLGWWSSNASSATLSGYGQVSLSGGMYVSPQQSTTYTLTAHNSTGQSRSCAVQVIVR